MSSPEPVVDAARELVLVFPRLIGRIKKLPTPEAVRSLELTPRHLALLSMLLLDGPLAVSELAGRLGVAPTTVSLLVSELSGKRVLRRRVDDHDRRRRIVDLEDEIRPAVERWLAPGARAWQDVLGPLTPAERRLVVDTLLAYEAAVARALGEEPTGH